MPFACLRRCWEDGLYQARSVIQRGLSAHEFGASLKNFFPSPSSQIILQILLEMCFCKVRIVHVTMADTLAQARCIV